MDNSETHTYGSSTHDTDTHLYGNPTPPNGPAGSAYHSHSDHAGHQHSYVDSARNEFAPAIQWVKEHPWVCVAAVAAVIAIGPRRLARTVASSGGAIAALTLRNPQNMDMLTKLVTQAADYMQRDRTRYRP